MTSSVVLIGIHIDNIPNCRNVVSVSQMNRMIRSDRSEGLKKTARHRLKNERSKHRVDHKN